MKMESEGARAGAKPGREVILRHDYVVARSTHNRLDKVAYVPKWQKRRESQQ